MALLFIFSLHIQCEVREVVCIMNMPIHHRRIQLILEGFDQGRSFDQIKQEVFISADQEPPFNYREWIEEVFNNRAWFESMLLTIYPGVRRRLYWEG